MKKLKNNQGITLIALIITIIILVILAAVSIRAVTNMGIVGHAINGTQDYARGAVAENNLFDRVTELLDNTLVRINGIQDGDESESAGETSITAGKKATGGNKEYTSGSYTAIIPEGWTVSGKTGDSTTHVGDETSISTGLVIYYINDKTEAEIAAIDWTDSTVTENLRKTYDQFVWIPIPRANINKMFMCQSEDGTNSCRITLDASGKAYCSTHSSNLMAGRLYADPSMNNGNLYGEIFNASLTTQTYNANSGLKEPAIVTGYGTQYDGATTTTGEGENAVTTMTNLSQISEILGARTGEYASESYASANDFKTTLQNEYNAIVKSVYNNEGYWVGRYETSGMANSNTAGTIKVIAGASNESGKNPSISDVNWYRMYAQQKKYAEGKGMLGGMIQGAAHDQMLMFANTDANYTVTRVGQVAHGPSQGITSVYETGNTAYPSTATVNYNDIANNIYDLEGNVFEWTTEANVTYGRVRRGGFYSLSYSASYRSYNYPDNTSTSYGTRQALYIK